MLKIISLKTGWAHTIRISCFPSDGPLCIIYVRDHPFMTSTQRGGGPGSGGCMLLEGIRSTTNLEPTDIILPSSHAKTLTSFVAEFHLWTEDKAEISLQYKLVN